MSAVQRPEESLRAGQWRRAGETDSPLAPKVLEAIARRPAATIVELLHCELSDGGVLMVVGRRIIGLEQLVDWLAAMPGDRVPAVIDLAVAPWRGGLPAVLHRERQIAGGAARTLVLLRPDRMRTDEGCVDGLTLREALAAWTRDHVSDWVVALVGPLSIAARHPLQGAIVLEQPDDDATENPVEFGDVRSGLARADATFVADFYRLAARPSYEPGAPPSVLIEEVATLCGGAVEALEELFRCLVRAQLGGPLVDGAPRARYQVHATAAASLYCLLAAASGFGVARRTLRGVALERWLLLLRSVSYETLAAVTSSMHDEQLAGCHLSQAPPLEFADLRGANFDGADLYRLNLADADLRGATFRGADLARAHLKEADLRGADLSGADITYASLEQADLSDAELEGADLSRSFLDHARGLSNRWMK